MTAAIIGWAHGKFGKLQQDYETLIVQAAKQAMLDAEVTAKDIDAIVLGSFGSGFQRQEFPSSLVLQADDDLRFTPAVRVENACATGCAAVHLAIQQIKANTARYVLVVGAEKMTEISGEQTTELLMHASYLKEESDIEGGFAGIFAHIAAQYYQRYGDQSEALAHIAAKNHKNGMGNPYAHMQKELSLDFCRQVSDKNPYVVGVLKRSDCSLVSDGAAALVLCSPTQALQHKRAVAFRAACQKSDFLPMRKRDIIAFEGAAEAWRQAHRQAGTSIDDLSLVETHDCFTIAELIEYEAMGLTKRGYGAEAILQGHTNKDGKLPINPSGGLKSKGHPIGATGVSMHALCAMQLTDSADSMQVPNASLAGIFNMGGAAVANYVSILERIK